MYCADQAICLIESSVSRIAYQLMEAKVGRCMVPTDNTATEWFKNPGVPTLALGVLEWCRYAKSWAGTGLLGLHLERHPWSRLWCCAPRGSGHYADHTSGEGIYALTGNSGVWHDILVQSVWVSHNTDRAFSVCASHVLHESRVF